MNLLSYRTGARRNIFAEWYNSQSFKVKADCDSVLKFLRQRSRLDWKRPHYDTLRKDCDGLGEIRFKSDRAQHRLVGYMGPVPEKYTVLVPAKERDGQFVPPSTCRTALDRMKDVQSSETFYCKIDEGLDE